MHRREIEAWDAYSSENFQQWESLYNFNRHSYEPNRVGTNELNTSHHFMAS